MPLHPQLEELAGRMLPLVKRFHAQEDFAPHAAAMDASGEVTGNALIYEEGARQPTVAEALERFESAYRQAAAAGEIVASAVFFHGAALDGGVRPAATVGEAAALVFGLEHESGQSLYLAVPYARTPDGPVYEPPVLIEKPVAVFTKPAPH